MAGASLSDGYGPGGGLGYRRAVDWSVGSADPVFMLCRHTRTFFSLPLLLWGASVLATCAAAMVLAENIWPKVTVAHPLAAPLHFCVALRSICMAFYCAFGVVCARFAAMLLRDAGMTLQSHCNCAAITLQLRCRVPLRVVAMVQQ